MPELTYRAKRKLRRCPCCGHTSIASILYGEPALSPELHDKLQRGSIVLGGCVVSEEDPAWRCNDCGTDIYKDRGDE